jgi:hypothetical protein
MGMPVDSFCNTIIDWKVQRDKGIKARLNVSKDSSSLEIAPPPKNVFGRFWQSLKSFFGFNDLAKVASIAEKILSQPEDIPTEKKAVLNEALALLKEKIAIYNGRTAPRSEIGKELFSLVPLTLSTVRLSPPEKEPPASEMPKPSTTRPLPQPPVAPAVEEFESFDASALGDVAIPFIGKRGAPIDALPLEHEKETLSEDDKKTFLALGQSFDAQRIKGDGHCLFRTLIVDLLSKYSPEQILKKLDDAVQVAMINDSFKEQSDQEKGEIIEKTKSFVRDAKATLDAGKDPKEGILLLRRLAVSYWRQQEQDRILPLILSLQEGDAIDESAGVGKLVEYFEKMEKMGDSPEYGTYLELQGLCSLLDVRVGVIDLIALKQDPKKLRIHVFGPDEDTAYVSSPSTLHDSVRTCDLFLIHDKTNQHFQAAFLKS